ncbi:MAG TPA: SDR family NAD(P)-dependent oxidoreductase [Chitinophagaceae bacterium]|nr:SDR family NAD(P)-dependent oxidoreductase [Chitinophagaceae bacterium]
MSATILITGGTGFLGSYIIKQLVEKGYNVRAMRRSTKLPFWIPQAIFKKVEWVDGDVLDVVSLEDAMEGVDTVIHSAAVVSFNKSDRSAMYRVNVEGTANVVNIALEKKVKKLVHVSSVAAIGRNASGGSVNEEKKWEDSKINTHYARSKFKAELHVWRGMSEGLDAIIANPSTILGYGDWHSSSCAIFKQVYEGFKWYTTGTNGFVDVEDTAKAVVMLMESNINSQRFIINAETWPFRQLQNTIAVAFGKKMPARKATPFLLSIAWKLEKIKSLFTGKKPLLTRESARIAKSSTRFENDKILKVLPEFSFTPLAETIQKACEKYAEQAKNLQPNG